MQIFTVQDVRIVPSALSFEGEVKPVPADPEQDNTGQNAFVFNLSDGIEEKTICLLDRQAEYTSSVECIMGGKEFKIIYGSEITMLPFKLRLNDFILEHYPGSSSPSGYKSDVTLIDDEQNTKKPFVIFMNNVLKYRGFRFYQSSYDEDEKGTILSVNNDMAGMMVTYTGYALLFLFIILSLLVKTSSFRTIKAVSWNSSIRRGAATVFFFLIVSGMTPSIGQRFIPDKKCSEEFGKVLVQDQKGRTKPLFALSNDILRKVTRENKFEGNTSMQVFLGILYDFERWKDVPLIMVSNKDLQKSLGISGNMAAFKDLVSFEDGGSYKLTEKVTEAYSKAPGARTKTDKEIMKVDERVNILYMIYTGGLLKIFPLHDDPHTWGSPDEALRSATSGEDSLYLKNIVPLFAEA